MEHWVWLPLLACMVCLMVWITGCTMTSGSSQMQSTAQPTQTAAVTLTVVAPTAPIPSPTRPVAVRMAAQPTPSPSPTPQVYIVQENDTLLDIAISLGVDLDALVAANPNIDPRALQIGQALTIPDGNGNPAEVALPPPPELGLPALVCYNTRSDSLNCLGVVENNQDNPVENVQVAVELLDNTGNCLGSQVTTLEQNLVPVGENAPYRVLFPGVREAEVGEIVVSIAGGVISNTADDRYLMLTVEGETASQQAQLYRVEATLLNLNDATSRPPRAVVTLYDGAQIVGYRVWQGAVPLAPGESTALDVMVSPAGGGPVESLSHTLHVEALALR